MKPRKLASYHAIAVSAGISLFTAGAMAQEPPPPQVPPASTVDVTATGELARRIAALEAEQRALGERLAAERKATAEAEARAAEARARATEEKAKADKGPQVSAAPGKGFTVKTADDKFSMNVRARIQMRNTVTIETVEDEDGKRLPDTNEINIKTLRLWTSGHILTPDLKYNIQLAFGGGDYDKDRAAPFGYNPIFDAWVEYTGVRDLNVRVGQFFVPFDRARTTREFALQFVDRPLAVQQLTLDRDVGIMVYSNDLFGLGGRLGYNLFVGGGEGRAAFGGQKAGPLVASRLALRPFGAFDDDQEGDLSREKKPRLAIGVAGGYNHQTNRQNSTYGAVLTQGKANYSHGAVDLVFKYAGFSFFTEAVIRDASKGLLYTGTGADGKEVNEWSRSGYGYFAQAGMMLTKHLEVTARWDELFAGKEVDPAYARLVATNGKQAGGGVNLYLNGHGLKLQADYFHIFGGEAPASGSSPPVGPKHVVRVQLDATF